MRKIFKNFPLYIQSEAKDCGPSCLKIIARYYGKNVDIEYLRVISETTRGGTSLTGLIKASEKIGMRAIGIKENFDSLQNTVPLPAIAHWNQEHFVVIYKITKTFIYVSDPELGRIKYKFEEFLSGWIGSESENFLNEEGILLILEITDKFFERTSANSQKESSKKFILKYLKQHKKTFLIVSLFILCASLLELAFPYLTQKIVDSGVREKNVEFIYVAAIAYILIFIGYKTANIIRNWIVIRISMNLNINLISDFIKKLTLLPISYYDSKITGDIFQRIGDHDNLEKFFTSNSIVALFSLLNILIFSGLFLWYDFQIFFVFVVGTLVHVGWVLLFFGKRKILDFQQFALKSKESNKIVELINGMQDIKLNGYEETKKTEWENIRYKLYKRDMKSMKVEQFQLDGASFINELKNISIIIISSLLVVKGEMTLGTLLAISYVIGHLNSPVEKLVVFLNNVQDIRLGFRRIMEIHAKKNEDQRELTLNKNFDLHDIYFNNVSFKYYGSSSKILNNLSFCIEHKKTTAIVGPSGCGKTTILKLLLKFYETTSGSIKIGKNNLDSLNFEEWRSKCGVITQDSYIFNDSIENNIILAQSKDDDKLREACGVSQIEEFINSLPLNYKTKIGNEGLDISSGQKQRILMARAIYKNPKFLLFDEATSALDANTEKQITENLKTIFKNRTVLLIAHRLSTVKNADQIIVLSSTGAIVELGTHAELIKNQNGQYHDLVKNQLELG